LYKDNFRHSSWLSLMRDRLELVQDIFSDDSSIFISNDDNENNRLNLLMNQIFGSQNFVAEVIWQKVYSPKNSAKYFSEDHDYITAYAKNKENWRPNRLPRSEEQNERYQNPDDDERGPWKPSDLTARNPYSKGQYEVESPSGKTFSPPTGRYWSISKEKFEELDADNRIWWGEDGTNMPHLKRFLSEVEDMVPQTLWEYDEVGHTQNAKKELLTFVDFERTEDVLNSVKPSSLLERILRIGTDDEGTEWVLDFFAGSGPTAHAAINLNREEGSDRRYVLVEMSDYFDTMIRPRIQRLVFSSEWKDGVPEENDGVSHLIKYQRLESYEDALNNIRLETPDTPQQQLFEEDMEDYVEGYMLDFEAEESASLLPEETFSDPFSHELEIEENGASREPTDVDLVETFHYLIGADVRKYWHDEHKERKYVITECDVQTDSGVEQILTVWRPTADLSLDDEADWFDDEYDSESYDRVYVNGESYIAQSEPLEITFREEMEGSPNVS
jgi:adenine-specific DNA-methyltransferase